jgi:hypothetical protein
VIVEPPLDDGGSERDGRVAVGARGANVERRARRGGDGPGTTAFEAADDGPLPLAFVALTVKVYDVPW